ncbi:MAG: hypothetical protein KAR39_12750 [Thermoplasmata archaeon]|nr:hypothetical protein [Thermoplasmata archaeon]
MTVVSGDIFRVAQHITMPEQVDAYNVIALLCTTGTCTDEQLLTNLEAWISTLYVNLQAEIHDQVDLAEGRVARMEWQTTEWIVTEIIGTILPTFVAANADEMLPHAVSPYVTMDTAAPTRKGKVKLLGFSEDMQSDSILVGGAAGHMADFITDLRTALSASSALLSYCVLGDDGTPRLSTAGTVRGIVGSQRQRRPGIGI